MCYPMCWRAAPATVPDNGFYIAHENIFWMRSQSVALQKDWVHENDFKNRYFEDLRVTWYFGMTNVAPLEVNFPKLANSIRV